MINRFFGKKTPDTFWVTNISKRNVSLTDLNYDIPALSSVNLLDSRHHYFTRAQLEASATSGSLFKKSDKIKIRKVPPQKARPVLVPFDRETVMEDRSRSAVKVEHIQYDELKISDDEFAKENADLAEQDRLGKYNK